MPSFRLLAAIALSMATAGGSSIASLASAGPVADSLSIEQCVARARTLGPAPTAAGLDRSAAAWDSVATSRNGRPEWSVDAGAMLAPQGFYDPTLTNLGDYQAKLGFAWTLSDGGRLARARERSGLDAAAAHWRSSLSAREAGIEAARLAIRLLRLQRAQAVRREAIEWTDRLSNLVRSGVASGSRSSSDSVRVALERDAAVAALEATQLESRIASLALLNALGFDHDTLIAIREPAEVGRLAPSQADSLRILTSTERLPEIQLGRLAEAQVRIELSETARRNAPTVELAVDAGIAGADLTRAVPENLSASDPGATFSDRLRRDLGASAAIRVHMPVLGTATRPAVRAREDALHAARVRSGSEAAAQRRTATVLIDQWGTASRQLAAADVTSQRAERSLLKVKSLYSGGATSLLDLLDAWRTYWDARERVEDAREQERVARFLVEDRR